MKLPLATKSDFEYIGGFKIQSDTYGVSRAGFSEGKVALGANRDTIFLAGHAHHHAIAEFSIPVLVNSSDTGTFNTATNLQPFTTMLNRSSSGNTQNVDRIGGMALIDGSLVINTYEYYDALQDDTHTTLAIHEPDNTAGSSISGFDGYDARAHASGWISSIPTEWQTTLKGSYITGDSSGKPIIGRTSGGPSAFALYPENSITSPHPPTTVATAKSSFSLSTSGWRASLLAGCPGNRGRIILLLREGSIVDATLIAAPRSTKNESGGRDPEMHQTKKGNQWHFGMKMHIGVDDSLGLIHSIATTSAEVHDLTMSGKLLHGKEQRVWGDAGYIGIEQRKEHRKRKVEWLVAMSPGTRAQLPEASPLVQAERIKASIRAKVEHSFFYIKRVFGYDKVRYRGLEKNTNRLHLLAAFTNLLMTRRHMPC